MKDAYAHSYVFRRVDGKAWIALTCFRQEGGTEAQYVQPARTWTGAMLAAEEIRDQFRREERKRLALLKVLEEFHRDYREAA